jgi:CheY-like chemotaxis protein
MKRGCPTSVQRFQMASALRCVQSARVGGEGTVILDGSVRYGAGSQPESGDDGTRGHVLVVEDDLIIADLIDQILRFENFRVSHVVDGRSAVQFVAEERPDLILMDLMLPVMGGVEASRLIKASDNGHVASIPVVAMSAGVNLRAAADDLPVDGVLAKPFDIDELLATVSIHVRRDENKD